MNKREAAVIKDEFRAFLKDNDIMDSFIEYCSDRNFVELHNFIVEEE